MLQQWSNHNHIALFAARAYKPKDKPAVEGLVKITYMRIYAKLRNETFHSLTELNQAIWAKLDLHHQINFQKKDLQPSGVIHRAGKSLAATHARNRLLYPPLYQG